MKVQLIFKTDVFIEFQEIHTVTLQILHGHLKIKCRGAMFEKLGDRQSALR